MWRLLKVSSSIVQLIFLHIEIHRDILRDQYFVLGSLRGFIIQNRGTVRLLVPGHFYFYAVSKFLLRENDISVLLLQSIITPLNNESQFCIIRTLL